MTKKSAVHRNAELDDAVSKSARTRSRILNAAAHILSVKGYAGTRLSDVAEYAELQAPAIYYYFASRDDLIEEVMYAGIADMRKHLQGVLDLTDGRLHLALHERPHGLDQHVFFVV